MHSLQQRPLAGFVVLLLTGLLLAAAPSARAQVDSTTVTVSGAGSSVVNGDYTQVSAPPEHARYEKANNPDIVIRWDSGQFRWVIEDGLTTLYQAYGNTPRPPEGTDPAYEWSPTISGSSPGPTLSYEASGGGSGVTVSGAGSAFLNGTYAEAGQLNGKTQYEKETDGGGTNSAVRIEFVSTPVDQRWVIRTDSSFQKTYYENVSENASAPSRPPQDGWQTGEFYGRSPAPTVSSGTGSSVDSTTVAVTGAGNPRVSGTYSEAGTHNLRPQYEKNADADYLLRWGDYTGGFEQEWALLVSTQSGATVLYTNDANRSRPPETGWVHPEGLNAPPTLDYDLVLPGITAEAPTNEAPTSATLNATVDPKGTSATVTFEVVPDGGGSVQTATASPSPVSGSTPTSVSAEVTGLSAGTSYSVTAIASNGGGEAADTGLLTTPAGEPAASTGPPQVETTTRATLQGTVNPRGAETDVRFIYYPTDDPSNRTRLAPPEDPLTGTDPVDLSVTAGGLQPGTQYTVYVRGENDRGVTAGTERTFTTTVERPTATIQAPQDRAASDVDFRGSVDPGGGQATVEFEYFPTGNEGAAQTVPAAESPVSGSAPVPVSATAQAALTPGTDYTVRLRATNNGGTGTSSGQEFVPVSAPTASTGSASRTSPTDARLQGTVDPGGEAVVSFEYHPAGSPSQSSTVLADLSPVAGTSSRSVEAEVTGLDPSTEYTVRTRASNDAGTAEGSPAALPPLPAATTQAPTGVAPTEAVLRGSVNPRGTEATVEFEYGTVDASIPETVTAAESPVTGSSPTGVSVPVSDLAPGQEYEVTVRATNDGGTTTGSTQRFSTPAVVPTVSTPTVENVSQTEARFVASVNPGGDETQVTFEYYPTGNPGEATTVAANQSPVSGTADLPARAEVTGLTPGTEYTVRVRASNGAGTQEAEQSFTTLVPVPTASTGPANQIAPTEARLEGSVNPQGGEAAAEFEVFPTGRPGEGRTVPAGESPVTGTSSVPVSTTASGLAPGTDYTYRLRASSEGGTATGSEKTFSTPVAVPTASTDAVENLTETGARFRGQVNPGGAETTVEFEYHPAGRPDQATTVAAAESPLSGTSPVDVSADVSGLSRATEYTVRVRASNSAGTEAGSERAFTTLAPVPTAATDSSNGITDTEARLFGTVDPKGGEASAEFEVYPSGSPGEARTLAASQGSVSGASPQIVSTNVQDLTPNTEYVFSVQASNRSGTDTGGDLQFSTTSRPNLTVKQLEVPATVTRYKTITLSWTVENTGNQGTGAQQWTDRVWISRDTDLREADDVLLGRFPNQSALDAGDAYSNTKTLELPPRVQGPTVYVFVTSDLKDAYTCDRPPTDRCAHGGREGNVPESGNILSNFSFQETTVNPPPPVDLDVTNFSGPGSAFSGSEVDLQWTVKNEGANPTPDGGSRWADNVYWSDDRTISRDDSLVAVGVHEGVVEAGASYTESASFEIPRRADGTRYLLLEANESENAYEDGRRGNNVAVHEVEVTLAPPPDLVVDRLQVRDEETAGDTTVVEWTVANDGAGAASAQDWQDEVYRSSDATFDPETDERVLAATRSSALASQETYTRERTVLLPDSETGTFHYFVRTDGGDRVFEFNNEDNNLSSAAAMSVSEGPAANLRPESVAVQDPSGAGLSQAQAGQRVRIAWSARNAGEAATAVNVNENGLRQAWQDRLYISQASSLSGDSSPEQLKEVTVDRNVQPGETYQKSQLVELPSSLEGTYYVYAVVNADGAIYEPDESSPDTVRAGSALSVSPAPTSSENVALSNLSVPTSSPSSGDTVEVEWSVQNTTSEPTNSTYWTYDIYLSEDASRGEDRRIASVARNEGLGAGQTARRTASAVLPNDIEGTRHVFVELDLEDATTEDNTAGTSTPLSVSRSPARNLVVKQGPTLQEGTIRAGQPVTIGWTVENAGAGEAPGGWKDVVYLSSDDRLDKGEDRQLGYTRRRSSLAAGGTYQVQADVQVPADLASGQYSVIVQTDEANDVYERDGEEDNAASSFVTVQLPDPADLVAKNVQAPDQAQPNETVTVSYDLQNEGSNPAQGTVYDAVYFSADDSLDADDAFAGLYEHEINIQADAEQAARYELDLGATPDSAAVATAMKRAGSEAFRGSVPGVTPGDYHVIVKPNVRRTIRETSYDDPAASEAQTDITVPSLQVGAPKTFSMDGEERRFFAFDAPGGQDLRLSVDADASAMNLFVSRGEVPSRSFHDHRFEGVAADSVGITLPEAEAGRYYVLAYAEPGPQRSVELRADELTFGIGDVHVDRVGDFGTLSLIIDGAKFTEDTEVSLQKGGKTIDAGLVGTFSSTEILARFRVGSATRSWVDAADTESGKEIRSTRDPIPHGDWDLVAEKPGGATVRLPDAVTVEGADPYEADVTVDVPNAIRVGNKTPATLRVHNPTNRTLPRVIVTLTMPKSVQASAATNTEALNTLLGAVPDSLSQTGFNEQGERTLGLIFYDIPPGKTSTTPLQIKPTSERPIEFEAQTQVMNRYQFAHQLAHAAQRAQRAGTGATGDPFATVDDVAGTADEGFSNPCKCLPDHEQPLCRLIDERQEFLRALRLVVRHIGAQLVNKPIKTGVSFSLKALLAAAVPGAGQGIFLYELYTLKSKIVSLRKEIERIMNNPPEDGECPCTPRREAAGLCEDDDDEDDEDDGDSSDDTRDCISGVDCGNPPPPSGGQKAGDTESRDSQDPNDILGPDGFGPKNWVAASRQLGYTIRFENDPEKASAPARTVRIRQPLDEDVDAGSFRLGPISFGDFTFTEPGGESFYSDRLDVTDSLGVIVEVTAGLDVASQEAFWVLRSIDPATGQPPTSPLEGFLPVNDSTGRGQGSVRYTVRSAEDATTGTRIDAQASIVFDQNAPIETPEVANTVEAGLPSSELAPVNVEGDANEVVLSWTGQDAAGGTGVASYSLYRAKSEGSFSRFETGVQDTSYVFSAERGYEYRFFVRAVDRAGNREPLKQDAEATALLGRSVQVRPGDANDDGRVNQNDILPVGLYFGKTGPKRDSAGTGFAAQAVPVWATEAAAYADANGDGVVNQNDLLSIGSYFGSSTEQKSAARRRAAAAGPAPDEAASSISLPPMPAGTRVPIYLRAGKENQPVETLLGWAAELSIPSDAFAFQSAVPTGALGENPLPFQRFDESSGRLHLATTRRAPNGPVSLAGEKVVKVMIKATRPTEDYVDLALRSPRASLLGEEPKTLKGTEAPIRLTSPKAASTPESFALKPNHPNPAQNSTTIRFSLPKPQTVTLEVYDILGRRVAQIKRDQKMEAGWHAVSFDASRFASGTYFYRLRAGEFRKARRMVVVK
jgi:hypothetical protein